MNAVPKAARFKLPAARVLECTAEEYHRDPCEVPSLSSSTAKVIVSESALHAWSRHPRFAESQSDVENDDDDEEASEEEHTEAKDSGSIIHNLLLGKGPDIAVIEANSFRTKVAKAARDEARAAGQLPILIARFDALNTAAEALRRRLPAYGYELKGESELPIEWFERGVTGPVLCRSMLDHVFINEGVIYDLKTIRSANPKHIGRTWIERGYDIQATAYPRALESLNPELEGRIEMDFLFMEIKPPYAIVPCIPDGAILEVGKTRWGRAVRIWETCLAQNTWPAYTNSRITVEAPNWQITEQLGQEWAE